MTDGANRREYESENAPVVSTDEQRYLAAFHGMQSGVAWEMNFPETQTATEPKHLRVGVNNALVQNSVLVKLFVEKGLFTMEEYWKMMADEMEAEVKRYEDGANAFYGYTDGRIRFR